ncbi:DUF3943 domain-containing protein [Halobacteriovorax sp. JY17]|uniref:DUF3943 domain-containing protein n=1 Tax=Halobacteriovorax sp. JY17 TaxID=2014617 RepID=UPI000C68ED5D|nr:DUF3943 domain-containing protein [Halobacteriovorax sp. JY17]PIK15265.1 MAG: hypothetical protein CES88_00720 [Halobacteriovorax sp. JY17]
MKYLFILLLSIQFVFANEVDHLDNIKQAEVRPKKYQYTYIDRDHTQRENLLNIAGVYGVSWLVYPLSQPETFFDEGSFKKYGDNFGKLVFDQDEPFWNWIVHPASGSQLFLFYRANGYSRIDSLTMSFISSTLFEFTVEVYTEPASIQDLYQTPILGAVLGVGIENLSLYLLNTGNMFGRFLGHLMNPSTLFWYYEGKIQLLPTYNGKDKVGLYFSMDF